jgi:hypothetical protein
LYVFGLNTSLTQYKPSLLLVQPVLLKAIFQLLGKTFLLYYVEICTFPARITIGSRVQPRALIYLIIVTYSVSPGCITDSRPLVLVLVTTLHVAAAPI